LRRLLIAIAFLLLGFLAYGGWQVYRVYNDVHKIYVPVPRPIDEPTVVPSPFNGTKRINVLVLGSDNDKKKEEARPLSQSMIVVTIDPVHSKVGILSIPRDFWVPIPRHHMGKIMLAYKYGGVQLARETVEHLFPFKIDYYAWVGLNGFIKVIDTFNGVTLDVNHPVLDDSYPNDLTSSNPYGYKRVFIPAGWQHMDGSQALEYVRSRHGDLIGDFGRSARQQQVLLQLRTKAAGFSLLQHLLPLADELSKSVRTDVAPSDLLPVERLVRRIQPQDINQTVLSCPAFCSPGTTRDGQDILIPYWPKIRATVRQMFAPIASATARTQPSPNPRPTPHGGVPSRAASTATARATPLPTATPRSTPVPPAFHRLAGKILFVKDGNLFELRSGQDIHQLTFTGDVAMPVPSPKDPSRIALVRFPNSENVSDIWLLDSDTGKMTRVTNDASTSSDVRNNMWAIWPMWSPDGSRLLFSSDQAKLRFLPSDARAVDLAVWSWPLAGGSPVQLTVPAQGAGGDTSPVWRPGSTQFAYVKWDYTQTANQPYSQIYLRDTVTSNEFAVTPVGGRVLQPSWDAGGQRLAFVRRSLSGVDEIVVAAVQQTSKGPQLGPRNLIARGEVGQPSFSPDGRWISFVRAREDGFALYVAPANGGRAEQVPVLGASLDGRWRPVWIR